MVISCLLSGLSPRVRGSRPPRVLVARIARSIPACAGEPGRFACGDQTVQVYPRVCGGAGDPGVTTGGGGGLSPRVRGSPVASVITCASVGSIPACAGEPGAGLHFEPAAKVYPRVCGGAENIVITL